MVEKIAGYLSQAAVLEQMAEEAAEMAQAALKCARILRGENPTPVTMGKACESLGEEYADVMVCASVAEESGILDMDFVGDVYVNKMERWLNRLEGKAAE